MSSGESDKGPGKGNPLGTAQWGAGLWVQLWDAQSPAAPAQPTANAASAVGAVLDQRFRPHKTGLEMQA